MRSVVTTIAVIAFTCALAVRLEALLLQPSPATIWLWLAWHRIARRMTGGPAPLLNCDVAEQDLVRDSYSIILKSNYSFEQHKQAVGHSVDLDAATERVFDSFPGSQTMYFAMIKDPSLLDSIRADPGVELIECDVLVDFSRGVLVDEQGESLQ